MKTKVNTKKNVNNTQPLKSKVTEIRNALFRWLKAKDTKLKKILDSWGVTNN